MKLISLDLETTGLCHECCDIIEIAAIFFDTDVNTLEDLANMVEYGREGHGDSRGVTYFHAVIDDAGDPFDWEPGAYNMHRDWYGDYPHKEDYESVMDRFIEFVGSVRGDRRISLAGANVTAFDGKFLPPECNEHFRTRALDIGSLYFNGTIPSLSTLKTDYLLEGSVTHRALQDAYDVARLTIMKCI